MESKERPDEAGVWERDGKFYRVWFDGHYDRIQGIDAHNGFSGDHNYLKHENTPLGNWRKLTPEPVTSEAAREDVKISAVREKLERYKQQVARQAEELNNWRVWAIGELTDEANGLEEDGNKELRRKISVVISELASGLQQATPGDIGPDWQRLREWAKDPRKKVPHEAFTAGTEREIAELICMCEVAATPKPVVIEGRGQAATKEQEGWYLVQDETGRVNHIRQLSWHVFAEGYRYMRCPTFPPRKPAFVPPEKPEQFLVRAADGQKGEPFYVSKMSNGLLRSVECGNSWHPANVELLDPTTGEPINEGKEG